MGQTHSAPIALYSHFHKPYPFNFSSSWLHATTYDDLSAQASEFIPVANAIDGFRRYFPEASAQKFGAIFGTQATEYWLYRNPPDCPFIGTTTYRRYLLLHDAHKVGEGRLVIDPNPENLAFLSSDLQLEAALRYLSSADVVTNRSVVHAGSIQEQYLASQPALYWDTFLRGIDELFPEYRRHLLWFTHYNNLNYETTYIMKRELYQKYARELFALFEYVFLNAQPRMPDEVPGERFQYYRYPGFLGERYLPFFIYANALIKFEVPLVFCQG